MGIEAMISGNARETPGENDLLCHTKAGRMSSMITDRVAAACARCDHGRTGQHVV